MRAATVKRAWGFSPVTWMVSPGLGGPDCFSGSFSQLPGYAAAREGSAPNRTNDVDTDQRRRTLNSAGAVPLTVPFIEGSHERMRWCAVNIDAAPVVIHPPRERSHPR